MYLQKNRINLKPKIGGWTISIGMFLSACGGGGDSNINPQPQANTAGDLISTQAVSNISAYASAASVQKIRYRMKAVTGGLTEANAVLLLPQGVTPAGGWPLVVWAHGTTGVADSCAPSLNGFANDKTVILPLLNAGYAVLAPDYEGLDAPGIHPYLIADSEAYSVLDAVLAAQKMKDVVLTKKWAIVGHSEGGHAALASTQYTIDIQAQYPLVAVVAFAPGSDIATTTDENFAAIKRFSDAGNINSAAIVLGLMNAYGSFLSYGTQTFAPNLDVGSVFGENMKPILSIAAADTDCRQFPNAVRRTLTDYLVSGQNLLNFKGVKPDWYLDPQIKPLLVRTEVGKVKLKAPIFLAHGSADLDVPIAASQKLVDGMKQLGSDVTAVFVPNLDHEQIVVNQLPAAISFIRSKWN